MLSKTISFLVVGLCFGALCASLAFALSLRGDGAAASAGRGPVRELKLAHSLDDRHPVHLAMLYMAGVLDQKSQGRLRLQILANGTVGGEGECLEQLQNNALDLTKVSAATLESFVPRFAVMGVPYVFRDEDHYWRVLNGDIGRELLAAGEAVGMKGLCYYDAGARSFYTINRPILRPEDLQGLKIRVMQSKTALAMVEALGGSPTPIDWGELYSALQTRAVDGAENNLPSYYSNRHFEVCREFSLDEHTRVPDVLIVGQATWESLSPEERRWLQEAADESASLQRRLWADEVQRILEALQAEGVGVHRPDRAPFEQRVEAMQQGYDGTPVGDLIKRIKGE